MQKMVNVLQYGQQMLLGQPRQMVYMPTYPPVRNLNLTLYFVQCCENKLHIDLIICIFFRLPKNQLMVIKTMKTCILVDFQLVCFYTYTHCKHTFLFLTQYRKCHIKDETIRMVKRSEPLIMIRFPNADEKNPIRVGGSCWNLEHDLHNEKSRA